MTADLTVLYDADCGLCTHTARALARIDSRHRLRLVPLQAADIPGMPPPSELMDVLRAVDADAHWFAGAGAALEVARRVPLLRPISVIAQLPMAMSLYDVMYRVVADHRRGISRRLGLAVCRVPSQKA